MLKKLRFFFSMKFAIGILLVLVIVCTLGSVIPQGNSQAWYIQNYSSQLAGAIMLFGLQDVFHSWWFVVLTLILVVNLLGCNLIHLPGLIRRTREGFTIQKALGSENPLIIGTTSDPEAVFKQLGFHRIQKDPVKGYYAVKNLPGIWGPWLCHLGMLIIIVGFGLGQMYKVEYTVYGVPGQTKPVGDTVYALTINDFEAALREDDTVEQYTSSLTLTDTTTGESWDGSASVNHPLSLAGMKFYQNSTGWAATAQVSKDDSVIQEEILCAGEEFEIEEHPGLIVTLAAFYPDTIIDPETGRPATASSRLENPGYLYRLVYQDQVLGMNVLTGEEVITLDDMIIRFTQPQPYSLIQIKRDPFTWVAAIGGGLVLLALVLAFYLRTAEIWAVPDREDGCWKVGGRSRKGGVEFTEQILKVTNPVPDEEEPLPDAEEQTGDTGDQILEDENRTREGTEKG